MAITINYLTKVINVPKADMTLVQSVPSEIRELDIDDFRLTLRDLEDSAEGMLYQATHSHNTTVTVGGVTLARVVEIINGYTITFEDGQYAVNLVGANSNIADVTNVNQVSVRSANSAGLVEGDGGSSDPWATQLEGTYTAAQLMRLMSSVLVGKASGGPNASAFRDINDTRDRVTSTSDSDGNRTAVVLDGDV